MSACHLNILRAEHLDLQEKYNSLKQRYDLLAAKAGDSVIDSFCLISQLQRTVRTLFERDLFSDINIHVDSHQLRCHRFLLFARTEFWKDIDTVDRIDIDGVTVPIFRQVLKWMYTDELDATCEDDMLTAICEVACRYEFIGLQNRCTRLLIARLDVKNCVPFFELADRNGLIELKDKCAAVVAARWNEFGPEQFIKLSAPLLYSLLKGYSANVLHSIIELNREDVLFLYLIENDSKLDAVVNKLDEKDVCPLELALVTGHLAIADQLCAHKAKVDVCDSQGTPLFCRLVRLDNAQACIFLQNHGANLKCVDSSTQMGPLHFLAANCFSISEELLTWMSANVDKFDLTHKDRSGATPLLCSIRNGCATLTSALLKGSNVAQYVNMADDNEWDPLSVVLLELQDLALAESLIQTGANVDVKRNRVPLIHYVVHSKTSAKLLQFLLKHNVDVNSVDAEANSSLHVAVEVGNVEAIKLLTSCAADANANSFRSGSATNVNAVNSAGVTPVHLALRRQHSDRLQVLSALLLPRRESVEVLWNIRDENGATALEFVIEQEDLESAAVLVKAGAPVHNCTVNGMSLLISTIQEGKDAAATFLLDNGAKPENDASGRSCLELAVTNGLVQTLKTLCSMGVNIHERTDGGHGFNVLEKALMTDDQSCAELLVSVGCDVESWTVVDGVRQTLFHYMMNLAREDAAVFLIKNHCNINARMKSDEASEDDGQTPVHLAVAWGLLKVLETLVAVGADLNAQDCDGRTACHVAIRERNRDALALLLSSNDVSFVSMRDKLGQTPLSLAIANRDNKSAEAIVQRQPHAALQTNGRGENLLHTAVRANDLESVLFLLGTHTDPTRATADALKFTALHLAAEVENEMILRNLILAGCDVNTRASEDVTALHMAAAANRSSHVTILLENGANPNAVNARLETPLLSATRGGACDAVRVLVSERRVNTRVFNNSGQSALHLCACLTPDRTAASYRPVDIVDLILKSAVLRLNEKDEANFVDARDEHGNTALLLAYMHGNVDVCKALLKRGAAMGAKNNDGISVFTYEMPTKQLLFVLLESLEREPRWSDGDVCDCGIKFSITQRKHHCRHCGRLCCSKCSEVAMPIAKFGEEKKVRVCSLCVQLLTVGR